MRRLQGSMPTQLVLLPTVIAAVLAVSACDTDVNGDQVETFRPDQAEYASICTDRRDLANPDDDVRVDDALCGDSDEDGRSSHGGFSFVYINLTSGHSQTIPAYGQPAPRTLGSDAHPRNAVVMRQLANGRFSVQDLKTGKAGSVTVQRGGFGVKGGTAGSSGG